MEKAKITEIFSSIQGEGLYVGEEHLFVRFYGCNLGCGFCDENSKNVFLEYTADELIDELIKKGKRTISLTGGEPLLHADFLKKVLPLLKEKGFRIYLETNGTLTDKLLKILDYVDIISMDLKLPSSTGRRAYWQEHSMFLKEAVKKELFVKSVITRKTLLADIKKALSIVKAVDKNIPFIIQPASYNGNIERVALLSRFLESAKEELNNVRVIPQLHKILGVK